MEDICQTYAYQLIASFYGTDKTKRSQVPFIHHIHEGLVVLQELQTSLPTQEAYCLHPIFQSDETLMQYYQSDLSKISNETLILVMEYRSIANQYLSQRIIKDISEIKLSPLKEVNQMLIADKVQNYKDFVLYHQANHPRSKELTQYFHHWFDVLGIEETQYQFLVEQIKQKTQDIRLI